MSGVEFHKGKIKVKVEATVKSVSGVCNFGHKVGDKVLFDGKGVRRDICYTALLMLLPQAYAIMNNALFPWKRAWM